MDSLAFIIASIAENSTFSATFYMLLSGDCFITIGYKAFRQNKREALEPSGGF